MEKVDLHTADIAEENAAKLAELFPDVVTEVMGPNGELRHSIDVEALKAHVGDVAEDKRERYQFTWPGKQRARAEAMRPIDKTLRPCREKSVNWDDTQNLYIEGDNLDALKILREAYAGKVKMIYIDPPYNTGHDFVYNDSFARSAQEEREDNAAFDDEGNLLDAAYLENTEANGRFHSDWCTMMYPRLMLARDLLSEEGVAFVSIDENEVDDCQKLLKEVFGASNYIATINWRGRGGRQDSKHFALIHEYILCCAKAAASFVAGEEICSDVVFPKYDVEKGRYYKTQLLRKWGSNSRREDRPNLFYAITAPDGSDVYPMIPAKGRQRPSVYTEGRWRWSANTMKEAILDGRVEFTRQDDGTWIPYEKIFAPLDGEEITKKYTTWIDDATNGTAVLKKLFGKAPFDYSKSPELLDRLINMADPANDDLVLDFFSGSATTAHAVMKINAEDGGNRKFIMVQLPEACDEKSEAAKAGYKTICEIGEERIRRAGAKIVAEVEEGNAQLTIGEEPKELPDVGFRVFKVDSSNFADVAAEPEALRQDSLFERADNLKDGRSAEDILYQLFPRYQIPYSAPVEAVEVCGRTVYKVGGDGLVACFDRDVPEDVIRAMAELRPTYAVMRDASFAGDDALSNFAEIFKTLSPETVAKVV